MDTTELTELINLCVDKANIRGKWIGLDPKIQSVDQLIAECRLIDCSKMIEWARAGRELFNNLYGLGSKRVIEQVLMICEMCHSFDSTIHGKCTVCGYIIPSSNEASLRQSLFDAFKQNYNDYFVIPHIDHKQIITNDEKECVDIIPMIDLLGRGQNFEQILMNNFFNKHEFGPNGFCTKTVLTILFHIIPQEHHVRLVAYLIGSGIPIPYIFHDRPFLNQWVLFHRNFSFINPKTPVLMNVGSLSCCGKSTLMNKIFRCDFDDESRPNPFHTNSVEFLPSSTNYPRIAHLIDVHGGLTHPDNHAKLLVSIFPSAVILFHILEFELENPHRLKTILSQCKNIFPNNRIIFVIRDISSDINIDLVAERLESNSTHILTIPRIMNGALFDHRLDLMKDKLFSHLKNSAQEYSSQIIDDPKVRVVTFSDSESIMINEITNCLSSIDDNCSMFKQVCRVSSVLLDIYKLKHKFISKRREDYFHRNELISEEERDISLLQSQLTPSIVKHPLIDLFLSSDYEIFSLILNKWYDYHFVPMAEKRKSLKSQIKTKSSSNIEDTIISVNAVIQEVVQIYIRGYLTSDEKMRALEIVYKQITSGQSVELINGDILEIPTMFLTDLFSYIKKNHSSYYQNPYVVGIIGPQSSGKSTLLNIMFGAKFLTKADRCTKGFNISFIRTDYNKANNVILIDTEGLFSAERNDPDFDVKTVTSMIPICDSLLLNFDGSFDTAKRLIEYLPFDFNGSWPQMNFILRNCVQFDTIFHGEAKASIQDQIMRMDNRRLIKSYEMIPVSSTKAIKTIESSIQSCPLNYINPIFSSQCVLLRDKIFNSSPKFNNIDEFLNDFIHHWNN